MPPPRLANSGLLAGDLAETLKAIVLAMAVAPGVFAACSLSMVVDALRGDRCWRQRQAAATTQT